MDQPAKEFVLQEIAAGLAAEAKRLSEASLPFFPNPKVTEWRQEVFAFAQSYMKIREDLLFHYRKAGHGPTIRVAFPSFNLIRLRDMAMKPLVHPVLFIFILGGLLLFFPLIFLWKQSFDKKHKEIKQKLIKVATLLSEFPQA